MNIRAIKDQILVTDMNFDNRVTSAGIILRSDDGKQEGIRPRWAKVYAIGPLQKDVNVGQYVLIEHGRWTRGNKVLINGEQITIRKIDNNALMLVSDDAPIDDYINTACHY